MKVILTIHPEEFTTGKDLHHLSLAIDGEQIGNATLTLDEIEDLEVNMTDILLQLSTYRRSKQREELEL